MPLSFSHIALRFLPWGVLLKYTTESSHRVLAKPLLPLVVRFTFLYFQTRIFQRLGEYKLVGQMLTIDKLSAVGASVTPIA